MSEGKLEGIRFPNLVFCIPSLLAHKENTNAVKIFIDESGDLGFTERSSKYFVVAALIVYDHLAIHRCFKKIRQNRLKKKYRDIPEFKFNNSGKEIKERVLKCIAKTDADIAYCVLRKDQVHPHLRDKHAIVYNYLIGSLVSNITQHILVFGNIDIIVDKSLNGIQRDAFDQYLVYRTFERNHDTRFESPVITIEHVDSCTDPCIQAVDFIAGALHHYYRTNDDTYFQIIDGRIKVANDYFEGPQK